MIAIIDYGMGNLGSVKKKIDSLGEKSIIVSTGKDLKLVDKIILPGVGHFARAVSEIKARYLWEELSEQVLIIKKPILGICLGMQLMAAFSEEGNAEGFGWLNAKVVKFSIENKLRYKVPHMGWNSIEQKQENPLLMNFPILNQFYFVHSYHMECNDVDNILATTSYESDFISVVNRSNIFGTQFHPEKSHAAGDILLKNFLLL